MNEALTTEKTSPGMGRRDWGRIGVVVFLALVWALGLYCRYNLRYVQGYDFYAGKVTGIPQSDAECFSIHALNLISGRGFGDYIDGFRHESFVPPGHPIIMGFWYFFLGNRPMAVGWAIAIAGSFVPILGFLLVRAMWGRGPGCAAAFLLATYGPYIRLGYSPMSEPSAILTSAVALWLWARMMRKPAISTAVLAGISTGFAALVRPSALAIVTGMAPWLLAVRTVPLRRRLTTLILFALVGFAPLGAWQIRNRVVHGQFGVSYTWNSVIHQWIGAHPKYGPDFYSRDIWHEVMWRDPYATELQKIERMRKETGEFIRADRVRYFFSCLWRMGLLDWRMPYRGDFAWAFSGWYFATGYLLYVLAWVGLLRAFRLTTRMEWGGGTSRIPGGVWAGAVMTAVVFSVLGAGFYGASDRYRWPLEYLLFPLAGLGFYSLLRLGREDLAAVADIRIPDPPLPRAVRWPLRAAAAAGIIVLLVYVAGVARAYRVADRPAEPGPECAIASVTNALGELGVAGEFAGQVPRWITYDMVFAQEAENHGYPSTYLGKVVAWSGRVVYPRYSLRGREFAMVFVVKPRANDFGSARLDIRGDTRKHPGIDRVKEGDIVTVIGRLDHSGGPRRAPGIDIMAVLPGFFIPPEAAEVRPAP
jgi:hypothetical protein